MTNAQIVSLYDNSNMSVEDIGRELGLEETSVKMILMGGSRKFREEVKEDNELFGEEDLELSSNVMKSLLYAENESVRYRASKFIINEKLGRNDVLNMQQSFNINVNMINLQLEKARKAIEKGKEKQIVEVESEVTTHLSE